MGYEKDIQDQYNKKYYTENKEAIALKQSTKECCKHCGRSVRHDNIWKHTRSAYCVNRRAMMKPTASEANTLNEINATMRNMERLHYEIKLMEYAARPLLNFN